MSAAPVIDVRPLVMLADDDPCSLRILNAILRAEFRLMTFVDGLEVLSALEHTRPALVVSDISMPRLDGLSLARAIKKDRRLAHVPVLMVTGRSGEEAIEECLEAGADDYVAKPLRKKEFLARVRAAVRSGQLHIQLRSALEALERVQRQLRTTLDCAADAIISFDSGGRILTSNTAAEILLNESPGGLNGRWVTDFLPDEQLVRHAGVAHTVVEEGGEKRFLELTVGSEQDALRVVVIRDVTWRVRAERRVSELQKELMESSRRAGRAEVATGVLHNVGNALNSINVSTQLVSDLLTQSQERQLRKLSELVCARRSELESALGPQGALLVDFCRRLGEAHAAQQLRVNEELARLRSHVVHATSVVDGQQRFAMRGGRVAEVSLDVLIQDAVEIVRGCTSAAIPIELNLTCATVVTDEQKLLEILVNLIKNGVEAVLSTSEPSVIVRSFRDGSERAPAVVIEVADNGGGLTPEARDRLFEHGFTTKPTGHGFGLHHSLLTAQQLGAKLSARSDGPGLGATFRLAFGQETEVSATTDSIHPVPPAPAG